MINLIKKLHVVEPEQASLTLPLASRIKSRLRARLDDGRDVGLFLERGQVLQHGDLLESSDGLIVKIIAANETVSTVRCNDALLMARASYHLGNRHIPLQISCGRLQYLQDHVLDDMMAKLGLMAKVESIPFEPESGAYASADSHHQH